jgi:hypothetical protein
VNDTGGDLTGGSESIAPTEKVAAAIRKSGGEAIADTTGVAARQGARLEHRPVRRSANASRRCRC